MTSKTGNGIMMTDTEILDFIEMCPKNVRYIPSVTMCGKYPCWSVTGVNGRCHGKTLREAVEAAMKGKT